MKNLLSLIVFMMTGSAFAGGECYIQKYYGDSQYYIQTGKVEISEAMGVQSYKSSDGRFELKLAYLQTNRFDAAVLFEGKAVLGTTVLALNSNFVWTRSQALLPDGENITLWCVGSNN